MRAFYYRSIYDEYKLQQINQHPLAAKKYRECISILNGIYSDEEIARWRKFCESQALKVIIENDSTR